MQINIGEPHNHHRDNHHRNHPPRRRYDDRHYRDNRHHYGHRNGITIRTPGAGLVMGIFVTVFAAIVILVAIFATNIFNNEGYVETTGVIVDYTTYYDMDGTLMYTPIAEFEVNGVIYEVQSRESSSAPVPLGKEVKIQYKEENPMDSRIKQSILSKALIVAIPSLVGIVGIIIIIDSIKKLKRGAEYQIQNMSGEFNSGNKPEIEKRYEQTLSQSKFIRCGYCGCNNPATNTKCSTCSANLNSDTKF